MFVANAPFSLRTLAIFMPLMTRRLSKRTIPRRSPQPHFPPKIAWFQAETDRNWGWVTEFLLVVFQEEMSFNPRIRGFADPVFSRFQPLQTFTPHFKSKTSKSGELLAISKQSFYLS
jgi:hypothetical protein